MELRNLSDELLGRSAVGITRNDYAAVVVPYLTAINIIASHNLSVRCFMRNIFYTVFILIDYKL